MSERTLAWVGVVLCLLGLTPAAHAGDKRFGFFVGPNFASRYGADELDQDKERTRMRSCVGGFTEIDVFERGMLRIEPSLVGKGSQGNTTTDWPAGSYSWKRSFEYIEIPVLLKMTLGGSRNWTPYVIGGPAVGFLLLARYQSEGTGFYISERDVNVTGAFPRREFEVAAGGGLTHRIAGKKTLFAEMRYALALSHTNSGKNRGLRINVGLMFDRK